MDGLDTAVLCQGSTAFTEAWCVCQVGRHDVVSLDLATLRSPEAREKRRQVFARVWRNSAFRIRHRETWKRWDTGLGQQRARPAFGGHEEQARF